MQRIQVFSDFHTECSDSNGYLNDEKKVITILGFTIFFNVVLRLILHAFYCSIIFFLKAAKRKVFVRFMSIIDLISAISHDTIQYNSDIGNYC